MRDTVFSFNFWSKYFDWNQKDEDKKETFALEFEQFLYVSTLRFKEPKMKMLLKKIGMEQQDVSER